MASKISKIFQSLRFGVGKLMGRTAGAEIVEPIHKEPLQNPNNNNILSTKVQNSVPRHDPFNVNVDADTNIKIEEHVLAIQTSSTTVPTEKAKPVSDVTGTLHRTKSSIESGENDSVPLNSFVEKFMKNCPFSGNVHTNTKVTSSIGVEVVSADVAPSIDSENNKNMPKLYSSDIERTAPTSTSDLNTPVQLTRSSLRSEKAVPIRKVIKPHTPLITFRKGSLPIVEEAVDLAKLREANLKHGKSQTLTSAQTGFASIEDKQQSKATPKLYEWWDTPTKFRRRKLDDMECDIINSGGCEQIYC